MRKQSCSIRGRSLEEILESPRKTSRRWCVFLVRQEMERITGEAPVSDIGILTGQQLQPESDKKPAEAVIEDLNEEGPPIDERTMQDIADAMAAFRNM